MPQVLLLPHTHKLTRLRVLMFATLGIFLIMKLFDCQCSILVPSAKCTGARRGKSLRATCVCGAICCHVNFLFSVSIKITISANSLSLLINCKINFHNPSLAAGLWCCADKRISSSSSFHWLSCCHASLWLAQLFQSYETSDVIGWQCISYYLLASYLYSL